MRHTVERTRKRRIRIQKEKGEELTAHQTPCSGHGDNTQIGWPERPGSPGNELSASENVLNTTPTPVHPPWWPGHGMLAYMRATDRKG